MGSPDWERGRRSLRHPDVLLVEEGRDGFGNLYHEDGGVLSLRIERKKGDPERKLVLEGMSAPEGPQQARVVGELLAEAIAIAKLAGCVTVVEDLELLEDEGIEEMYTQAGFQIDADQGIATISIV